MKYPIAYLITFTTYGTWLHGDKRGSVDEKHNRHCSAFVAPNPDWKSREQSTLKNPPFILDRSRREAVLQAILQVCDFRGWFAHAVHVRSNHIHIVVSGKEKPEKTMVDFKAYATRAIGRCAPNNSQTIIKKYWTQHGSAKYLWTKKQLASTIGYVKNEQGKMMAFGAMDTNRAPNVSEGVKK